MKPPSRTLSAVQLRGAARISELSLDLSCKLLQKIADGGPASIVLRAWEMELPSGTTAGPMTYMLRGKQYIVVSIGSRDHAAEFVALALP